MVNVWSGAAEAEAASASPQAAAISRAGRNDIVSLMVAAATM